jgi:uncharacterized protein (DUF58 family)
MKWPFVSRARFEDREQQILELKKELAETKLAHARVVDEINFRSTGFHLDPRFAQKPDDSAATTPAAAPEELTGISKVISEVGTRPSAIRKHIELTSMSQMEKAEREAAAGREAMLRAEAAKRLEEVLDKSRTPATA